MTDQLDVQIHLERTAIRREFEAARARVAEWRPLPYIRRKKR